MGKSKKAPEYATTTAGTGGLFGSSVTSKSGTDFTPTDFRRNFVNTAQTGMQNALSEYLNPNYNTDAFKQSDSYYKNKMYNTLQNDYLNTALSNNLMRDSTATDTMRGFAKDLANTEYERQQDYKNQQLQKLQAALLGYNTIYDMSKGVTGLSNALAQSAFKREQLAQGWAKIYNENNNKTDKTNNYKNLNLVQTQLERFEKTFEKMPGKLESNTLGRLRNTTGFETELEANFNSQRQLLFNKIARDLGGEKGVLSDQDIKRIENSLPKYTDSLQQKKAKMKANHFKQYPTNLAKCWCA